MFVSFRNCVYIGYDGILRLWAAKRYKVPRKPPSPNPYSSEIAKPFLPDHPLTPKHIDRDPKMRTQVLAFLGAVAGALAQDTNATVVTDNPADARYIALLEGAVTGRALASSDAFGRGVNFHVSLDGLPEGQGPFSTSNSLTTRRPLHIPCLFWDIPLLYSSCA